MELEDIAKLMFWSGLSLISFSITRKNIIKSKEIKEKSRPVYLSISRELANTNIYMDPKKYHELNGIKTSFETGFDTNELPSIGEWNKIRDLMRKYNLN